MDDNQEQNRNGVPESGRESKEEVKEAETRICDNDAVDELLERQGVAVSTYSGRNFGHGGCAHCTLQPF